ncbi:MAG: hypothetical protein JWM89_1907 [Acidimicrobiales bacterium]|nr:hypothetical protein [Acidimicrobiales bacterium]
MADDWVAFRQLVFDDPALARTLAGVAPAAFVSEVVAAAAERGLAVEPAEVDAAVNAGRRAWFERWI